MKPAATRIAADSKVKLPKWDADEDAIIGKDKSDARERLEGCRDTPEKQ